jgi:UDPglucose 6-dehydrogenase
VFFCLPSPTIGGQQLTAQFDVYLERLSKKKYKGLVVIKSTVLPHNIELFKQANPTLRIATNPEFLNQSTSFDRENKILIGVDNMEDYKTLTECYCHRDIKDFLITDAKTAMFIKYVHNCFGALKVTFFNEIFDICRTNGLDYRTVVDRLLKVNDNIGKQYTTPAADGSRGFAGACFPKDSVAFENTYLCYTLAAAIEKNKEYRNKEMSAVMAEEE